MCTHVGIYPEYNIFWFNLYWSLDYILLWEKKQLDPGDVADHSPLCQCGKQETKAAT